MRIKGGKIYTFNCTFFRITFCNLFFFLESSINLLTARDDDARISRDLSPFYDNDIFKLIIHLQAITQAWEQTNERTNGRTNERTNERTFE